MTTRSNENRSAAGAGGFVAKIDPIDFPGWTGGLNREADPFQLEATESPDALNVDFELRGAVTKRKGYTKFNDSDATSVKGLSLTGWITLANTKWMTLVDTAGDAFYMSVAASEDLVDTTFNLGAGTAEREYQVASASLNNKLYITSLKGDKALRFDGTTWVQMDKTPFDNSEGKFPPARALVANNERFFAGNVENDSGTEFRSRVHWSAALDPEQWAALDFIDFAPDNGQEITGLAVFAESIVVFKNRSMFVLAGTDASNFTVYPLDPNLGTDCPGTIVNAGTELYFFDRLTGVWRYDGSNFNRVDDKINRYLLEGINQDNAYKSTAFTHKNRYFLSIPWGEDTTPSRTFVYDPRIKAWTEYDFGVADASHVDEIAYAVAPRDAVGVYRLFNGLNDNGADIDGYFWTHWLAPGGQALRNRIRRLDLALSALGNFDIDVTMRRDFIQDTYRMRTLNTSPGGTLWDVSSWGALWGGLGLAEVLSRSSGWGDLWAVCQFQFRHDGQGEFSINRMTMQVSSRPRVRGLS